MKRWLWAIAALFFPGWLTAQEVVLVGETPSAVERALLNADYAVKQGGEADLSTAALVDVDGRKAVKPALREALAKVLKRQGSVLFLGSEAFHYTPEPNDARPLVDLTDTESYVVERDKRD